MTAFQIRNNATSLELFDAAEARQTAARDALRLLASSDPASGKLLSGTLAGIEILLREATQLYEAARQQA